MPLSVAYPGGARYDLGLGEALLLLAIFVGVSIVAKHRRERPGRIAAAGIFTYALGRFIIEFLRADDLELIGRRSDPRYGGLTLVQYDRRGCPGWGCLVVAKTSKSADRAAWQLTASANPHRR
jgi:hypothetical protein